MCRRHAAKLKPARKDLWLKALLDFDSRAILKAKQLESDPVTGFPGRRVQMCIIVRWICSWGRAAKALKTQICYGSMYSLSIVDDMWYLLLQCGNQRRVRQTICTLVVGIKRSQMFDHKSTVQQESFSRRGIALTHLHVHDSVQAANNYAAKYEYAGYQLD